MTLVIKTGCFYTNIKTVFCLTTEFIVIIDFPPVQFAGLNALQLFIAMIYIMIFCNCYCKMKCWGIVQGRYAPSPPQPVPSC